MILVICGPTATGKTDLAIKLAKDFNGELVSADSRQVYKGMDIGTGKDVKNSKFQIPNSKSDQLDKFRIGYYLVSGIKIWLLDIVKPDYRFTVADYVKCANLVITDIWQRKKLPIIVGGTGLYIKAMVDGIGTLGIPPDWELRKEAKNLGINELRDKLKKIDPDKLINMNQSDINNPRRLIRAIEIARNYKFQIINFKSISNDKLPISDKEIIMIGLTVQYNILYNRIDKRVDERIKNGVIDEIKSLHDQGYSWDSSALGTTIGYREWQAYTEHNQKREDIIKRWKFDEHGYARRQMTWFKKDSRIKWFDIAKKDYLKQIVSLVEKWYNTNTLC